MYRSDGNLVVRSLDGEETVFAQCANPFLANFIAYQFNRRPTVTLDAKKGTVSRLRDTLLSGQSRSRQ